MQCAICPDTEDANKDIQDWFGCGPDESDKTAIGVEHVEHIDLSHTQKRFCNITVVLVDV